MAIELKVPALIYFALVVAGLVPAAAKAAQATAPSIELLSAVNQAHAPAVGASADSIGATLSADGSILAFVSAADDLVTNNHNSATLDVYVRDIRSGKVSLVSVNHSGNSGGNSDSVAPALSADGVWVVFESNASDLVSGDTNGVADIFMRNLQTGKTRLISVDAAGSTSGNGLSFHPKITPDGR